MMRSAIDEYRIAYEKTKWKLEIAEAFNGRYKKKISKLEEKIKEIEEENRAYKILLKQRLEEEVNNG